MWTWGSGIVASFFIFAIDLIFISKSVGQHFFVTILSSVKLGIVNAVKVAAQFSCNTAGDRTGHVFKMIDGFFLIWDREYLSTFPSSLLPTQIFCMPGKKATELANFMLNFLISKILY